MLDSLLTEIGEDSLQLINGELEKQLFAAEIVSIVQKLIEKNMYTMQARCSRFLEFISCCKHKKRSKSKLEPVTESDAKIGKRK